MNTAMPQEFGRFEAACREHGLKVTHQRTEVFRAVLEAKSHPSVEDIYGVVNIRIPSISLDTVYRTLDTFSTIGIVKRFMSADGRYRFDTNLDQHQHLVCMKCGKIEDVHWDGFERLNLPEIDGWRMVSVASVEIHGLCRECQAKANETT